MSETIIAPLPSGLLPDEASPEWLNKGDNAWQLTAAALVGLQSVPGLVILYGSMVKKKWAVNSAFMALYAFAAVLICWVTWAHQLSFGDKPMGIMGQPNLGAVTPKYLLEQQYDKMIPKADYVFYQFVFAAITVILLGGSLLGRMNFYAWMIFVPLWLTFSYTVGAYTIWDKGFLSKHIIDFSGGYVIHLSSGVAGFTAAYWVGPRHVNDRDHFPPNNIIHMMAGAGFLWMGWSGFNGGSPLAANEITSLAVLNTHLCTATSMLVWMIFDSIFFAQSSVVGAIQGMMTGLVCITPAAGIVDSWAAMLMGVLAGSIPWYTMMVLHKKITFLKQVDDTLGVLHTHAVAGLLGGLSAGIFAKPNLVKLFYNSNIYKQGPGLLYSIINTNEEVHVHDGFKQMGYQLVGAMFIAAWNIVVTSLVCIFVSRLVDLKMHEDDLEIGDDAVHGEEAYALWGDGQRHPPTIFRRTATRV
ncbi:putative ammonium transporter, blood group Rhesus C/E/D polypeptide, ammonium/urea transporter [Helianthus annuus]|nr:putative ammonium transporter, blood group Rhesus C/E/D polypeptide, ammonium/urea transporter [Helianthus annuus]